jgi:hypothetical protein
VKPDEVDQDLSFAERLEAGAALRRSDRRAAWRAIRPWQTWAISIGGLGFIISVLVLIMGATSPWYGDKGEPLMFWVVMVPVCLTCLALVWLGFRDRSP